MCCVRYVYLQVYVSCVCVSCEYGCPHVQVCVCVSGR